MKKKESVSMPADLVNVSVEGMFDKDDNKKIINKDFRKFTNSKEDFVLKINKEVE